MEWISAERREELYAGACASVWKLELRDRYGVDAARRQLSRDEVVASMAPAVAATRAKVEAGVDLRRIKTISEPPSAYMRGAYDVASLLVEAGEDIRWLPRRLASGLLLPGNDMFVLDGKAVMFNVHDGDDNPAGQQWDSDQALVARCREAFEAAWSVAVPHEEYRAA
ncbi:DUF6879 family protein [Actinomadura gamaensis]|uniref:DUF6879 family protein n=1 Tax=Actinomadura gamaensis TaxID=1763541 RepID=A0ABV9U8T9_9ACTN